ncbi:MULTISPECIES: hypothetical protein [Arthrobacter]|nr:MULTISPECIES: hypothetical protein [Arthrobacter]
MSAQVTEAELKAMTPEQIVTAHKEGRLSVLLGAPERTGSAAS